MCPPRSGHRVRGAWRVWRLHAGVVTGCACGRECAARPGTCTAAPAHRRGRQWHRFQLLISTRPACFLSRRYALHCSQVKYYDAAAALEAGPTADGGALDTTIDELARDLRELNPGLGAGGGPTVAPGDGELYEELYGAADLGAVTAARVPAVTAAHGAVMLSYSWGAQQAGTFPNQQRVLTLADTLTELGFAVWVDVNWMMGNMDEVRACAFGRSISACVHCVGTFACAHRGAHGTA